MFDALGPCIRVANAVAAILARDHEELRAWPVIEESGELEARMTLMVAEPDEGAFAGISIDCSVPEGEFGKGFIEVQVQSADWREQELQGLKSEDMPEVKEGQGR